MKIVHIEDFFHPDAGYQINVLPKYMVKHGYDVTIVTSEMDRIPQGLTSFFGSDDILSRDKEYSKNTGVKIIRLPLKNFLSGRAVFRDVLFAEVDRLDPDVLYIHGNDTLTAMRYLLKIRKLAYPIVMDSHMLEMASINKFSNVYRTIYKKIFTPIIVKNNIPVIRTQDDPYVQKCLGIPLEQCPWISFGTDTMLFHPDSDARDKFRKGHHIRPDDFVIIYTGKLDEAKGGLLLAQAFEKKFKTDKNIVLLVVGNTNGVYGEQVEKKFRNSENRIIRFPTQKYVDLPQFYQAADLSVFPKQCSLSFFDAQACGLPVISEGNQINIDRLKFNNGSCFKAGDIDEFRSVLQKYITLEPTEFDKMKNNAAMYIKQHFDYEKISVEYENIIEKENRKVNSV